MVITGSVWDAVIKVSCLALLIAGCSSLPANDPVGRQQNSNSTDLFAYPAEQSAVESKQNARNRTPIFIPERCQENEILYPGDHENDWVCDCKPTYIYHPQTGKCYQMYTQGYCQPGKILYIERDGKTPKCIPNECKDGQVKFGEDCGVLNAEHKSCLLAGLKLVIGINEHTHQLECVNISGVTVNSTLINNNRQSSNATG